MVAEDLKIWPPFLRSLRSFTSYMPHQTAWNDDFHQFVTEKRIEGVNIDGEPSFYVAHQDLDHYWSQDELIQQVLNDNGHIPASPTKILNFYLRIWSTLVVIGQPQFIVWFIKYEYTDDGLGLSEKLDRLAEDHVPVQNMLHSFDEHRWQFWPLMFLKAKTIYDKPLDARCVLPITFEDRLTPIGEVGKTIVQKVRLHDACCDFEEKTVVFKIYQQNPIYRAAYKREKELFEVLSSESPDVIVECFGSFRQNEKSVIILEYAAGGNLADFLETAHTPATRQEFYTLWTKLADLISAVYHINNLPASKSKIGCAHRDIKLENILVFPTPNGSIYDFILKLTDFDTISDIREVSPSNDSRQYDDGGKLYCAPEASRIHERERFAFENVPLNSDIWSLGAVFSDIIVWLAEGPRGVKSYEAERKKEISKYPEVQESGYGNCFHDGLTRLECVEKAHERALGLRRVIDDFTPNIKDLIEQHMLVPYNKRPDPKTLRRYFTLAIEQQQQLHPSDPRDSLRPPNATLRSYSSEMPRETMSMALNQQGSPLAAIATANPRGRATTGDLLHAISTTDISHDSYSVASKIVSGEEKGPRLPEITVENANAWLARKRKVSIPGMDLVLRDIRGRDQLFVIDDSITMARHADSLYHTIKALFAFACKVDPDRVEVVFASDPTRFIKDKRFGGGAEYLARKVLNHFDSGISLGSTNMESKLSEILGQMTWMKKTSIYIMTDAVWQPSDEPGGGVERPLTVLMKRLMNYPKARDFITLQFIYFGDEPDDSCALKRLKYLDDGLAEDVARETKTKKFDIVDHRRHNDNVSYMLMGAYSSYFDEQDGSVQPDHKGFITPKASPIVERKMSWFGYKF